MSSTTEPSTGDRRGTDFDRQIDEFDAVSLTLGRLMAARHSEHDMCGLSMAQALALRALEAADGLKASDIAHTLGIKAPATTALVDALVASGLAERRHDENDRRITRVRLTEAGRERLHAAEAARREHVRRYLSVLSDEDIAASIRIQRRLIDALTQEQ